MRKKFFFTLLLAGAGFIVALQIASGQRRGDANPELIARRNSIEKELQSIAIVERKLMIPMRDGKRMATDVYRPKDTVEEIPHDLRSHAIQLQFLGRPQWRAARHDAMSSRRSSAATPSSR